MVDKQNSLLVELEKFESEINKELHNVMSFWLIHSNDKENGGFFNCLGEDGHVYDSHKYVWMLGRQVWTYCRLYNETETYHKKEILEVAEKAADFLCKYAKRDDNRCYFCLTEDGKPVKLQRTIFSESFYVMAMSEIGRATGKIEYKVQNCVCHISTNKQGISFKIRYPVHELLLKNITLRRGPSRMAVYGSTPPPPRVASTPSRRPCS